MSKRLHYSLQQDTALQGAMVRIFVSVVERCRREHGPTCLADARIGAIAFIHCFGSSLNEHVHFHCGVIEGVFEPAVPRTMRRAFDFIPPWNSMRRRLPTCRRAREPMSWAPSSDAA